MVSEYSTNFSQLILQMVKMRNEVNWKAMKWEEINWKKQKLKLNTTFCLKKRKHLWDTRMHLQMIEETQAMVDEKDNHEDSPNDEKNYEWIQSKHIDIWNDESQLGVSGQNVI